MSKYKLCVQGTEADYAVVHDFNTEVAANQARDWFRKKSGATAVVIHDYPDLNRPSAIGGTKE